ncbi:MAG: nickel-dependent lactate racemase [Candidatus Atribacteria bacterium]|nr:nickel-dependent lactate racemase [Candidatus Atribacteria bacterium]
MQSQKYRVPYSKSFLEFTLPHTMQATVIVSQPAEPLKDVPGAISEALAHPIGTKPLRELAGPGNRACIVFTDITRACPDHLLVPALLAELEKAGVRDEDITLLCGIGMHRPSTREENIAKLGAGIVERYRVIDNEPQNPLVLVDLGVTPGGVPIQLHRAVVEADLVIATGVVEPHQYAGYSGGPKTVAIGAAGEGLIAYTHGTDFIDHPGARLGRIQDNPFHEAVTETARRANLRFILNVVLDDDKRVLCVLAGEPDQAFQELVTFARSIYEVPIPHQYDIAIGGVGFPKDTNLYQASRAPSYLFFAPTPVVRPGGFLIIPARCEEGVGSGVGEQRFLAALRDAPDLHFILDDARRNGVPPGQQRAFVMAKVLEQARVVIVGSECPELVAACKMIPATTMEAALALASNELGPSCDVLIVPHALLTLPVINSEHPAAPSRHGPGRGDIAHGRHYAARLGILDKEITKL